MLRIAAVAATVLGIAAGASRAAAQPVSHGMRPLCVADLTVRAAPPASGDDSRQLVAIVSRTAGYPCVIANFPQVALAGGAAHPKALPAARLSVAQNATVGNGNTAAFLLRYATRSGLGSPEPAASGEATCTLALSIDRVTVKGPLALPVPCASLADIAVSSFASGTTPPDDALATPASPPKTACRPQDLELRDVAPDPAAGALRERYALQNVGLGPCRLIGSIGVVLRDAKGVAIPLKPAARTQMAMLLNLQRGHEASFTVAYPGNGGPNGEQRCITAASIAVTLVGEPAPITAPTHVMPCPPAMGPGIRVSNLQLGVPLTPPAL